MSNPIFIIGTERSGTNLLRLILNSHSKIAIPHPPHIMKNFFRLEPSYGDLSWDENFRRLIRDVVTMVELHPYPWEIKIDKERIFSDVRSRDLINIFFAVYDQYLDSTGKARWACKSTFMINHVALVRHYYPQAQFIYMVRDGRDVAVSAKQAIFNHYNVYYIAQLWKKEQQLGLYWLRKLPGESISLVKYEDLLSDPQKTVKSLCSFLNEPYEEGMLQFFKTPESQKSAKLSAAWKNTASPIIKDNLGKFKQSLKRQEIDLFEAISGLELDSFGYELTRPLHVLEGVRVRGVKFRVVYFFEEIFLMLKVQIRHFFTDSNNSLRYRKFWFLKFIGFIRFFK